MLHVQQWMGLDILRGQSVDTDRQSMNTGGHARKNVWTFGETRGQFVDTYAWAFVDR